MGNIRLITGVSENPEESDILPADDAAIYESICGTDGVFKIGENLRAEIISNNQIKIHDGVLIIGGRFARIQQGTTISINIKNGVSGQKRNTIILAKINISEHNDTLNIETKDGVPGRTATDPKIIDGNLYNGAKIKEMPLYRVKIDGINIVGIERMFKIKNLAEKGDFKEKEEDTGEQWYGKKIYTKTLRTTSPLLGESGQTLEINFNLTQVAENVWIDFSNSYMSATNKAMMLPLQFCNYGEKNEWMSCWWNRASIRLNSNGNWNELWEKVVTIRYTKIKEE